MIHWSLFGIVVVAALLVLCCVAVLVECYRKSQNRLNVSSAVGVLLAIGFTILWANWPTLHDSSDIAPFATPGAHISVVVDKFGEPSEYYESEDGSCSYLYAEGLFTGYTSIDTDEDGTIVSMSFVD